MTKEELAPQLYQAYGRATDFNNLQGNPMPTWEELPEQQRNAWLNVASYVIMDIVV